MDDGLTFNKVHCSKYGLEVYDSKRPLLAEFKDTYIDVPHRNGTILVFDTTKKDIIVEVEFLLTPVGNKSYFDACRDVAAWLTTVQRERLIFDDDPEYGYRAKVVGNIERERIAKFGQFTVQFRCDPDMFKVTP